MKPTASLFERVRDAARAVADNLAGDGADVAVVLGSGLASVADSFASPRSAPYASLPGFPETTVAGHPGRIVVGALAGRKVLALCGRVHGYEGYPPSEIGFGVRVAAALGARTLVTTNASGGVDPTLKPGEIVAISDQINLTGLSPLTGPNDERLGPRFLDMTDAYAPALRKLAASAASRIATSAAPLREAIYAGLAGPQYETPAEVRLLRTLGAGLVGMSTVLEVIAARHAGMSVLGLSLVANHAAGVTGEPLRHEDVTRAAAAGASAMAKLVAAVVADLP
jgi:purine-nucleoside phosphorylase